MALMVTERAILATKPYENLEYIEALLQDHIYLISKVELLFYPLHLFSQYIETKDNCSKQQCFALSVIFEIKEEVPFITYDI